MFMHWPSIMLQSIVDDHRCMITSLYSFLLSFERLFTQGSRPLRTSGFEVFTTKQATSPRPFHESFPNENHYPRRTTFYINHSNHQVTTVKSARLRAQIQKGWNPEYRLKVDTERESSWEPYAWQMYWTSTGKAFDPAEDRVGREETIVFSQFGGFLSGCRLG